MGEHVNLDRKAAETPNSGCKWCGKTDPPLFMFRVNASKPGPWEGPFCKKKCFVTYFDDPGLAALYVHTSWKD